MRIKAKIGEDKFYDGILFLYWRRRIFSRDGGKASELQMRGCDLNACGGWVALRQDLILRLQTLVIPIKSLVLGALARHAIELVGHPPHRSELSVAQPNL
jgi:hypothetical protein